MIDLTTLGKGLLAIGLSLSTVGLVLWFFGRSGLPLGRLPGDLRFEVGGVTLFIPLAASIVLSLVLTVILTIILRGRR
jgi:hypothetical protein